MTSRRTAAADASSRSTTGGRICAVRTGLTAATRRDVDAGTDGIACVESKKHYGRCVLEPDRPQQLASKQNESDEDSIPLRWPSVST